MDLTPGARKRLPRPAGRIYSQAFKKYVNGSDDVVGMIAYSFYKKSKVDWTKTYNDRTGENPSEMQIHEWASNHLTEKNINEHRMNAFLVVDEFRKLEILKANQGQIESAQANAVEIRDLAESTHRKVGSLTGRRGFWANIFLMQVSFICTTVLAGFLYVGLHVSGLEPLKWFSDNAPGSGQVRPRNAE